MSVISFRKNHNRASGLSESDKMQTEVNLEAICKAVSHTHLFYCTSEEFVMFLSCVTIRKFSQCNAIWHQSKKLLNFESMIIIV